MQTENKSSKHGKQWHTLTWYLFASCLGCKTKSQEQNNGFNMFEWYKHEFVAPPVQHLLFMGRSLEAHKHAKSHPWFCNQINGKQPLPSPNYPGIAGLRLIAVATSETWASPQRVFALPCEKTQTSNYKCTHRIHVWYICLQLPSKHQLCYYINLGKYHAYITLILRS